MTHLLEQKVIELSQSLNKEQLVQFNEIVMLLSFELQKANNATDKTLILSEHRVRAAAHAAVRLAFMPVQGHG